MKTEIIPLTKMPLCSTQKWACPKTEICSQYFPFPFSYIQGLLSPGLFSRPEAANTSRAIHFRRFSFKFWNRFSVLKNKTLIERKQNEKNKSINSNQRNHLLHPWYFIDLRSAFRFYPGAFCWNVRCAFVNFPVTTAWRWLPIMGHCRVGRY